MLWRGRSHCNELPPSATRWSGVGCAKDLDDDPGTTSCRLSTMTSGICTGFGDIFLCGVGGRLFCTRTRYHEAS